MFKILEKREKILLAGFGMILLFSFILLVKSLTIIVVPQTTVKILDLRMSLLKIMVGFLVFMIGGVMFLVGIIAWKMKLKDTFRFLYIASCVGMMGIYFFLQSDLMMNIFSRPVFFENLEWICWAISMISLFLYLITFLHSGIRRTVTLSTDIVMVGVCLAVLFPCFDVIELKEIITIGQRIMLFVLVFQIGCLYYEKIKQKNQEVTPILIPLLFLLSGEILEIVNDSLHFTKVNPYFEIGFIIFVLCMLRMMGLAIEDSIVKARKTAKLEAELLQSKISVMLSQMKPHFLFNSLNAISGLCLTDPLKADEAIVKFSEYLRENINALECQTPIPFDKELHHIKNYVDVEKMRFEERLRVNYDIGFRDFEIPTLALQPIVENAIRHGIGKKTEGGTVTLRTSCLNRMVLVEITDDGVGFDKQEAAKKKESVGMTNATERLKYMCNAQIEIDSVIGKGTTVKIWIPKKD